MILSQHVGGRSVLFRKREKKMKLRHARPPALRRNFSLNLADGDGGRKRISDRIFPFYLPVPQGQSIFLVYYMVNILKRRGKILFVRRWEKDGILNTCSMHRDTLLLNGTR